MNKYLLATAVLLSSVVAVAAISLPEPAPASAAAPGAVAFVPLEWDIVCPTAMSPVGSSDWDGNANNDSGASSPNQRNNPWLHVRLTARFTPPIASNLDPIWVPGFFIGDAGATSDGVGNYWRIRWTPPEILGKWTMEAWFNDGANINVAMTRPDTVPTPEYTEVITVIASKDTNPGFQSKGFILPFWEENEKGSRYYTFSNGDLFLKTGMDSPENFLAYDEFEDNTEWISNPSWPGSPPEFINTADANGGLDPKGEWMHDYDEMAWHWNSGDPTWTTTSTGGGANSGKGIIGALNYFNGVGVNGMYMLLMNLGGDGRDVSPFWDNPVAASVLNGTAPAISGDDDSRLNYHPRRLDQWEMVFTHAEEQGVMLQFVLAETEYQNTNWFDDGTTVWTTSRKLYMKNMVAMFGHHLGIKWILWEECPYTPTSAGANQVDRADLQNLGEWLNYWDVCDYDYEKEAWVGHAIAVHGYPTDSGQFHFLDIYEDVHENTLDADWWLTGTSMQIHGGEATSSNTHEDDYTDFTENFAIAAAVNNAPGGPGTDNGSSSRLIPVECDEQGSPGKGLERDENLPDHPILSVDATGVDRRKRVLYDVFFSGGAGIEWYCGYYPHIPNSGSDAGEGGDMQLEDFHNRGDAQTYAKDLREFLEVIHLSNPLYKLSPDDDVVTGEYDHPEYNDAEVFAKKEAIYLIYYAALMTGSGTADLGTITIDHGGSISSQTKATMDIYLGENLAFEAQIVLGTDYGVQAYTLGTSLGTFSPVADTDYVMKITFK